MTDKDDSLSDELRFKSHMKNWSGTGDINLHIKHVKHEICKHTATYSV